MALAADAPDERRARLPAMRPQRRAVRGVNLLAELEALAAIGGGRFDLGVHHVVNLLRARSLSDLSGLPHADPFAQRQDRRHWVAHVYEEDAYLLERVDGGVALALAGALAAAWPRLPAALRARALERVAELDDGIGRAWLHAGGAPLWRPAPPTTLQTHLVVEDERAQSHLGISR